jgi:hypothetical protein
MYVPLESVNLFLYIDNMMIYPLKYNRLDINPSIQEIYPYYILLSKKRWVENSNLSFEVGDLDENKMIQLDENFFLYPEPFSFSKVKNIYFQKEEQMKISVSNLTISTAPFPKQLLRLDESPEHIPVPKRKRIAKPKENFERKLRLFSKYLGALAVTKNVIGVETDFPKNRYFIEQKYREIEKIVLRKKEVQAISRDLIEKFAKREKIELEKSWGFYKLDKIPTKSLTYLLVILEKYDYKMNDNLAGLIEQNQNLEKELQNTFLLLYGLMLGYHKLPFKGEVDTKFRFDKEEDFQILEDIYKVAFEDKISKKERIEILKKTDFSKVEMWELVSKFQVSEKILKSEIRKVSKDFEVFEKFGIRASKEMKISKLEKILESGNFTNLELAEKLGVSTRTIRSYLKIKNREKEL